MGLRFVAPAHMPTICAAGRQPGRKLGSCMCGWSTIEKTSDDVMDAYHRHLAKVGAVHTSACDSCQAGTSTVRSGVVELCSRCAVAGHGAAAEADLDELAVPA